jgi:predicted ATPase
MGFPRFRSNTNNLFFISYSAAAKIVQTLFVFFFKLGGVLVATSNRLPEDLYATDFRKAQFATFFRILQARCVSHDMRSTNDYREILSSQEEADRLLLSNLTGASTATDSFNGNDSETTVLEPINYYYVKKPDSEIDENKWVETIQEFLPAEDKTLFFKERTDTVTVYGRKVHVPWQYNGVAYFDFKDICGEPLASADYISLASRYHTFIIDNVPALKITQKNEARRLITLLDALYECKCNLVFRSDAAPEDLFFADVRDQIRQQEEEESASLDQEMFSEVHQDLSAPFRPNVSSYTDEPSTASTPSEAVTSTNDAAAGKLATSSQENYMDPDPSNQFFPQNQPPAQALQQQQDFTKVSAFTGEDERFAYKRAVSRLKEMTGSLQWRKIQEWSPLDDSARPWETVEAISSSSSNSGNAAAATYKNTALGNGIDSPFRTSKEAPPLFDASHFWAMVEWGPGTRVKDEYARIWIRGTEILVKNE